MADSVQDTGDWALGCVYEGPDGPQIAAGRIVGAAEYAACVEDNEVLTSLTLGLGWHEVLDAWELFLEKADKAQHASRESSLGPEILTSLNTSVRRLLAAIGRFHERITTASQRIVEDSERRKFEAVTQRVRWAETGGVVAGTEWNKISGSLVDVVKASPQAGLSVPVVCLSFTGASVLGIDQQDRRVAAHDLLGRLVAAGEALISSLIACTKQLHEPAGRRLRLLATEVDLGPAALVRIKDGTKPGDHKLDILTLRTDLVTVLARQAVQGERTISRLLRDTPTAPARHAGTVVPDLPPTEGQQSSDAPEEPDQPGGPEEPSLSVSLTPSSLHGLLSEMGRLSTTLEHKWSRALELVLSREDLEAEMVRWGSLLNGLRAAAEQRSQRAASQGIDTTIARFPVPMDQGISLFIEGSQYRIETIGHLYAIANLASALQPLQKPVDREFSSKEGYSEFWSSGGFWLARSAATVAEESLRSLELVDPTNAEPASSADSGNDMRNYLDSVSAARRASDAGLPRAVLVYLLQASANFEKLESGSLFPDEFSSLLREQVGRIATGEPVGLGAVITLAEIAFVEVERKNREIFGGGR